MLDDIEKLSCSYYNNLAIDHFKYPNYIEYTYEILKCHCFYSALVNTLRNIKLGGSPKLSKSQKYITYIGECRNETSIRTLKGEIIEMCNFPFASDIKSVSLHVRLVRIKEITKDRHWTETMRIFNSNRLFEFVDVGQN